MKIEKKALLKALELGKEFFVKDDYTQIGNIFWLYEGKLFVVGYDGFCVVPFDYEGDFVEGGLSGFELISVLKTEKDDAVFLTREDKNWKIRFGTVKLNLVGIEITEEIKERLEKIKEIEVEWHDVEGDFINALLLCKLKRGNIQKWVNGVYLNKEKALSTDGVILKCYESEKGLVEEKEIIIPTKLIDLVIKNPVCSYALKENYIYFKAVDECVFGGTLLQEGFNLIGNMVKILDTVDWEKDIKYEFPVGLGKALKRAGTFIDKNIDRIRIIIQKGILKVIVDEVFEESLEFGDDSIELNVLLTYSVFLELVENFKKFGIVNNMIAVREENKKAVTVLIKE